jgi:antitoxin component YwqK of YwqJK toxin-antitoxin module
MKLPAFFMLLLAAALVNGQSKLISFKDLIVETTEDGVPVHYYAGQPFTGMTQDYYQQENVSLDHHLENGLLTLKEGFRNGQKIEHAEFENGVLDGTYLKYFDDGQKYVEHHYREGAMHGKQFGWNKDGQLRFVSEYKEGVRQTHINYPLPGGSEIPGNN